VLFCPVHGGLFLLLKRRALDLVLGGHVISFDFKIYRKFYRKIEIIKNFRRTLLQIRSLETPDPGWSAADIWPELWRENI
jgi:hypothetical protein